MVRNAHIISRIEVTKVTWAFTIIFFAGRSSSSILWAKALSDLGGFFTCLKMRFQELIYDEKCIDLFNRLCMDRKFPIFE